MDDSDGVQRWSRLEPVYITCSSCGERGYFPIAAEWWEKHTAPGHTLKWWIKRKLKA